MWFIFLQNTKNNISLKCYWKCTFYIHRKPPNVGVSGRGKGLSSQCFYFSVFRCMNETSRNVWAGSVILWWTEGTCNLCCPSEPAITKSLMVIEEAKKRWHRRDIYIYIMHNVHDQARTIERAWGREGGREREMRGLCLLKRCLNWQIVWSLLLFKILCYALRLHKPRAEKGNINCPELCYVPSMYCSIRVPEPIILSRISCGYKQNLDR